MISSPYIRRMEHINEHEDARLRRRICRACGCLPPPSARIGGRLRTARTGPAARRLRRHRLSAEAALRLEGWNGWTRGVNLAKLLQYRTAYNKARLGRRNHSAALGRVPASARHLFASRLQLYKISRRGKPIYIGMTGKSVADRVNEHFTSSTPTEPKLQADIRAAPAKYSIHRGRIDREFIWEISGKRVPDRRLLHAYEIVLQNMERPEFYNPHTTTFEEDDLFEI